MAKQRQPKINPAFVGFLPVATEEEDEILFQSIKDIGFLHPVVVREETGEIVDGHRRHKVWLKLIAMGQTNLKLPTDPRSFPEDDDVYHFMAAIQCGRRNLTKEQKAYYRGKEYLLAKQPHGGPRAKPNDKALPPSDTAESIAEKHGVSRATVQQDAKFAVGVDALPTPVKTEVLAGKSDLTKKEIADNAPLMCDRCKRTGGGPIRGCVNCEFVQAEHKKKKFTKKPKKLESGSMKYDWAKFKTDFGRVAKAADAIAKGYDETNSADHKRAVALSGAYIDHMKAWEKRLTRVES